MNKKQNKVLEDVLVIAAKWWLLAIENSKINYEEDKELNILASLISLVNSKNKTKILTAKQKDEFIKEFIKIGLLQYRHKDNTKFKFYTNYYPLDNLKKAMINAKIPLSYAPWKTQMSFSYNLEIKYDELVVFYEYSRKKEIIWSQKIK